MKESTLIRMQEILEFIRNYTKSNSFPPSVREICNGVGIKSTATVYYYLNLLEQNNYIRKTRSKNRAIEIIDKSHVNNTNDNTVDIPLIGKIAAGEPIFASESLEDVITISTNLFSPTEDLFMLKVKGMSMIGIGIFTDDIIVLRRQNTADNGDIVAAMIDGEATVKRFYKESNYYRLHPENDTMQDIITQEVEILGVVVGLVRQY